MGKIISTELGFNASAEEVRDIYLGAIKILEEGGWTQGQFVTPDGRHCMDGAMMEADGPRLTDAYWAALGYAQEYLRKTMDYRAGVAQFNDMQDSVLPVLDLLNILAKKVME